MSIVKNLMGKALNKAGLVTMKDMGRMLQIVSGSAVSLDIFGTQITNASYQQLVKQYRSWVYTCIDKIAKSVASLPLCLYTYTSNGKILNGVQVKNYMKTHVKNGEAHIYMKAQNIERVRVDNHPFYDLMRKPNKLDTRFTLWYNTMIRMELAGKCGWYIPKNKIGLPGAIWALPMTGTADLTPIPDPIEVIKGFKYVDGQLKQTFTLDEIVFFKYPNPESPFKGMSPLMAQSYPYDIENFMMERQYNLYKNQMTPGNILSTDQKLNPTQVAELQALILAGFKSASKTGHPMVAHSGLKLDKPATLNAKDMMIEENAEFTRQKLITGYDMSMAKVGLTEHVNRANMEASNKAYWDDNIGPKTMLLEEQIEADILPLYDDRLTADFELPSTEDKEQKRKETETNLNTGKTTINEERAKEGLEPVFWGDAPWLPFNKTQPKKNGEGKKFYPGYESKEMNKEIEWKDFDDFQQVQQIPFNNAMAEYFSNLKVETLRKFSIHADRKSGHINGWGQEKRHKWLKKKDRFSDINIDKEAEAETLKVIGGPIQTNTMIASGNRRLNILTTTKQQVTFDYVIQPDSAATQWLGDRLDMYSKEVAGTTFDDIDRILKEGFGEGLSNSVIADNLADYFNRAEVHRAAKIAQTETIAAINFADVDSVKQSGLSEELLKFWIDSQDGHVRDTHQAAAAEYADGIEVDKDFQVGSDTMDSPGNGSVAEENINCRCTVGYKKK